MTGEQLEGDVRDSALNSLLPPDYGDFHAAPDGWPQTTIVSYVNEV